MKKLTAIIIAVLIIAALAACSGGDKGETSPSGDAEATEKAQETLMTEAPEGEGEVEADTSVIVTDEVKKLVDKATDGLVGAEYEPVAVIPSDDGAQRVLCKMTLVVPNARPAYAVMVISADGELVEILHSEASAPDGGTVDGGWGEPDSPVMTAEALKAFEKAASDDSRGYEPIALLANQVVAGMNYSVLARYEGDDGAPRYAVLHIYADLDGGAEITAEYSFMSVE